jgi:plastocyanin
MRTLPIALAALALMAVAAPVAAADIVATVRDAKGVVPNVVVVAVPEDSPVPPAKQTVEVVDQIDKEFVPYVKPVRVGSMVQFPNKDNIRHHVYSFSPPKRFELPLYAGTPARPVLFDKPGVVKLGCNIHDWMIGYVYVAETPYFAKTGADGRAELKDLPAGHYRVRVWHPSMTVSEDATIQKIEAREGSATPVEWKLDLKREFRPRRAPAPGEPGYR